MAFLLKFRNVSLYKDKPFGVSGLSLDIERGRKYHLKVEPEEQLKTIAGLIEGRFQKDTGMIERSDSLFIQSDALLLGDKAYTKTVGTWLALKSDTFPFGKRRRSKYGFIENLKAWHLMDYPIYKLSSADKIKFTLLALAFQETGIILISKLHTLTLSREQTDLLLRIINESHAACCLMTCKEHLPDTYLSRLPELIELNLGQHALEGS